MWTGWLIVVIAAQTTCSPNMFKDYWKYQSYEKTVTVKGARFQMGNSNPSLRGNGEYPPRKLVMKGIEIDKYTVTNSQYWRFHQMVGAKIRSTAEKMGYSYVFALAYQKNMSILPGHILVGEPWWLAVKNIKWNRPEGALSNVARRMSHPVIHVSHMDAQRFCEWTSKRLPTEAEWEFAARGGLKNRAYPWGDAMKANRTNLWQGLFPYENYKYDGYDMASPVDAFPPQNSFGIHDLIGNVWEWTSTPATNIPIDAQTRTAFPSQKFYILKGTSFIDFREDAANINHAARISNRLARPELFTSQNIGFRCVRDSQPAPRSPQYHELATPPSEPARGREEL